MWSVKMKIIIYVKSKERKEGREEVGHANDQYRMSLLKA